ncbi:hypothetical protein FPV67DRAFT_1415208 [Lyophyllum atratum]|nr:hypothetical protein FPV67DRAFT_1415208 [Lyophyllum atratum]
MRNSSSPAFGGPPPPRYDPPNFGCFTCVTRDNDARLTYKGSWSLNGTPTATMHSSTERGASVAFRFNGSGIIVMGTVPRSNGSCKPPTATYILDASKPVVTTAPTASSDIPNQPLFFANGLSADEHELTIEVGGFGRPAPYIVQQFFVFPKFNVTQHVVDTLPTSSLKGPTRPTTSIISPTNVTSSLPNTPSNTISSSATIRVLAGTLGSLVVLIVLVVLFFIFRRRHQHHRTAPPKVHKTDKRSSFASSTRGLQGTKALFFPGPTPLTSDALATLQKEHSSPPPNPSYGIIPAAYFHCIRGVSRDAAPS